MFGKNKDDKIYQDGKEEGIRITSEDAKIKLEDKDNYYQGEIKKYEFEINRLNLKLKTWESQHKADMIKESDLKKRESNLKSDIYNMEKFKDMLRERLLDTMKEQVDGTQELLSLISEKPEQKMLEDKK